MTCPPEQSHGLPVLGHTCTPYVLLKGGCVHRTKGSRWTVHVGLLHKTHFVQQSNCCKVDSDENLTLLHSQRS